MKRPEITRELIEETAIAFGAYHGWTDEDAADVGRTYRGRYMDGYELAKELERSCGWSPTAEDVETLDCFGYKVREAHKSVCMAWARDNNIQPPFPINTVVTQGKITGIYAHDAACYEIQKIGDTEPSRRYIVKFEDVRLD